MNAIVLEFQVCNAMLTSRVGFHKNLVIIGGEHYSIGLIFTFPTGFYPTKTSHCIISLVLFLHIGLFFRNYLKLHVGFDH